MGMAHFNWSDDASKDVQAEAGVQFGDKGTHTSRTIMLSELTDLLAQLPPDTVRTLYAEAIIDANVLGKQTAATRRLTNQRLGELYGLKLGLPIFAVLRRLWSVDDGGRPLLAMLCALARDPLLRATAPAVLPLAQAAELTRTSMTEAIVAATGSRFNESILDKVARNASSSWTQSGHLEGRVRKIRKRAEATASATAFALWLGSLQGLAGEELLRTAWASTLDRNQPELLDLVLRAKQLGLLNARVGGGVVEIDLSPLHPDLGGR